MLNLFTSKTFSQMFYFRYFTSRKIIKNLILNNATQTNPSNFDRKIFNIMIFGKELFDLL